MSADEIDRAYLAQAGLAHPDRAGADADAARRSAELNEAHATLRDPERRAEALLRLRAGEVTDATLPAGFLMEMLEARESIDHELSADPSRAAWWRRWADERRDAIIARVAELFATLPDRPNPADAKAIRVELNAWRYLERLLERLDAAS